MRKLSALILALCLVPVLAASPYVASTSWVAAFMDLAGIDDVVTIAPPSLRHPPEYELTPSDVLTIMGSELFCYAGYERMMKTVSSLQRAEAKSLKVTTGNNLDNVLKEVYAIASLSGTEPRTEEYEEAVLEGRRLVKETGLSGLRAYVNSNQTPLAYDLGLNVEGVFGPGALTSAQLAGIAKGSYDIIIDNVHNPVAGPAQEVSDIPIVVWRNFPEDIGRNALTEVVQNNITALLEVTSYK